MRTPCVSSAIGLVYKTENNWELIRKTSSV